MDLELNDDQQMLVESVERLAERYTDLNAAQRLLYTVYVPELAAELDASGFLDIARQPDYGPLEAGLIVERLARLTVAVEAGGTALVASQLSAEPLARPLALIWADIGNAHRFLPQARAAIAVHDDKVVVIDVDPANVRPVDTILAFPYGTFITLPDLDKARVLEGVTPASYRAWARVALALECAGAMRAAVDFTVDYVKQRRLFGRALGSFQAVQHRLAQCHMLAQGTMMLALQAAESGDETRAALAAAYAQMHIGKITFDLHQFNGGMGMTNEHSLHLWTFRLRALMPEFGGADGANLDAANLMWSDAA